VWHDARTLSKCGWLAIHATPEITRDEKVATCAQIYELEIRRGLEMEIKVTREKQRNKKEKWSGS
jgi:hypothetical protein